MRTLSAYPRRPVRTPRTKLQGICFHTHDVRLSAPDWSSPSTSIVLIGPERAPVNQKPRGVIIVTGGFGVLVPPAILISSHRTAFVGGFTQKTIIHFGIFCADEVGETSETTHKRFLERDELRNTA